MIPQSKRRGFRPNIKTVLSAIRECRFHRTIAVEKMNPPRKTKEVSENIEDAIEEAVEIAKNGSRNTGKNAVITIGIGSKIHQRAVIMVIPKHCETFGLDLSSLTILNKKIIETTIGPRNLSHQMTDLTVEFIN